MRCYINSCARPLPLEKAIQSSIHRGNGTHCLLLLETVKSQGTTFEAYRTALTSAVKYNQTELFSVLLNELLKAWLNGAQLHRIVHAAWFESNSRTDVALMRRMLAIPILDINAQSSDNYGVNRTWVHRFLRETSLYDSVDSTRGVKLVMADKRCDINFRDGWGCHALSAVASYGSDYKGRLVIFELMMRFISRFDVSLQDREGRTALSLAPSVWGNGTIIGRLLALPGVDANHISLKGRTPLSYCARTGDLEGLTIILKYADPWTLELPDVHGRTPFYHYMMAYQGNASHLFFGQPRHRHKPTRQFRQISLCRVVAQHCGSRRRHCRAFGIY